MMMHHKAYLPPATRMTLRIHDVHTTQDLKSEGDIILDYTRIKAVIGVELKEE